MEKNNTNSTNKAEGKKSKDIIVEIPVEGSLGILAYGAQGLDAWRKKKSEVEQQTKNNSK